MKLRNSISLNCINQTLEQRGRLVDDLAAIGGGALMTDEIGDALALRQRLPADRAVVYRQWRIDDKELFVNGTDPVGWFNGIHAPGVFVQAMNEPVVTAQNVQRFLTWNLAVIEQAKSTGRRVAVGTFSVGNPHESLIQTGAFDPLIRALDWDRVLMLHEYFYDSPAREYPWLGGRVAFWLERAREIGHPIRRVFIGECGRDVGGGESDGWNDTGWTDEQYVDRLGAMMTIYDRLSAEYGVQIEAMIFCAGRGYEGRWQSFNVEGVDTVYDFCKAYNRDALIVTVEDEGMSFDWGEMREQIAVAVEGGSVNIRPEPNTSQLPVGSLRVGWRGAVSSNTFNSGGHQWRQIAHNGGVAYVAGQYVTWGDPPVIEPVPPSGLFIPGATSDELNQLAQLHTLLRDRHVSQSEAHEQIAAIYQKWLSALTA